MMNKKVAILAGTYARAEDLRRQLGIDAYTWSTRGGSTFGRGYANIGLILVDGSAHWGEDVIANIRPHKAKVLWIEPVEI